MKMFLNRKQVREYAKNREDLVRLGIQMNSKLKLFCLIIGFLMVFSTVVPGFSAPLYEPVVITFGNGVEEQSTLSTFLLNYPNSIVIKYKSINDKVESNILMRSNSPLIIIGHGSNVGIEATNNKVVNWAQIGNLVNSLPSTSFDFLVCYSSNAEKNIKKPSITFNEQINGPLDALAVTGKLSLGNTNVLSKILNQAISRITDLQNGLIKPQYLSFTTWYDGLNYEAGFPDIYQHPTLSYYQIYPQYDWHYAGNSLEHNQIGTNTIALDGGLAGLAAGMITGAIVTVLLGFIPPSCGVAPWIIAAITTAVSGFVTNVIGEVAINNFKDESGAAWFWMAENDYNNIVGFLNSIWFWLVINLPLFISLLTALLLQNFHYLRVGSITFINDIGMPDPPDTPPVGGL